MAIKTLINLDTSCAFLNVRDQIACILVEEIAAQKCLARKSSLSDKAYDTRVFVERHEPWSNVLGQDGDEIDLSPIVNVMFESSSIDRKSGSAGCTVYDASFDLEFYGFGVAKESGKGHIPADMMSSINAQRACALCRSILMSPINDTLRYESEFVWESYVSGIHTFETHIKQHDHVSVSAVKASVEVKLSEPEVTETPIALAGVSIAITRGLNGELFLPEQELFSLDIDY